MKFAVVIPAFNEEKRIGKVLKSTKTFSKNIIVVDDGSKDQTAKEAKKEKVLVIRHKINLGKGAALKTGCECAFKNGADFVITLDGDGQHSPDEIPKFKEAIEEGNGIVFGVRKLKQNAPLVRLLGNKAVGLLLRLLFGIKISDALCGFRAFTKKAYRKISWNSVGYGVETEMVAKSALLGLKYKKIPVKTVYNDKYKGLSLLNTTEILFDLPRWRITK